MADSQRRFCHPPPPPPPAHGCRQPAEVEQLEQAPVKQLPRWERLRLAVEAQRASEVQSDKQVKPQVEVPVISPFSPPPVDFRSHPSPVATVQAVSPPRAMAADAASSSAEQGTNTSTTIPPAPKKRRRKHMLSDYKRILERMTEDMPTGQEPDSRNEDPTDATSEVKTFYIGDGPFPDAGGEGAASDMSALSGGVTLDGSGTSAVSGGASESNFGVGTSAQSGGVLDMSAHSGGVHHEWDDISSSSSVPSLAAGATEQLQASGAPPDAMPSMFEASREDLATDIQSGVFSQDAKELDDTDVALLGRFADGEAVLSELQQQPSLRAPALEVASRLMAAGANSNVAFLPIVQGLATQQT
ncbi:unnamed protein product [Prorocentrum cordatum]|uniref:Uncharacterized protein n=1 Tax=Prorocentrum cordatum TaxID=2364126 RepID=A0ABN9T324_9DINO|nr:unnamed protein product [Polarella glacialis]